MSFTGDLTSYANKTVNQLERVKRKSAFELFSAVVFSTPVDKGVLRNNWFASINSGSQETTAAPGASGDSAKNRIGNALKDSNLADTLFLTNNLPYAAAIEFDGHSAQAPQGMVRVNALNWSQIVERNAKSIFK